ncbi:hypothetical protein V6O07_13190, partial [Arthrospira platensis SPKY2]
MAEVDHDPAHWQGAPRISYKTEPMEQYRPLSESFFDAELGVDRLESGNLLRQRFETQLVEWTKRRATQLLFAVQTEQEGRELTQRLHENPICRKLSFQCKPGHLSGGFRYQPDPEAHTASGKCELPLPREGC